MMSVKESSQQRYLSSVPFTLSLMLPPFLVPFK